MFKWDTISWIASAIFALGLALGAFVNDAFLILLAAAYLLRPALLAFGFGKKYADERQMTIQYHSGNIALIVLILVIAGFYVDARIEGKPGDTYALLLCIALATKAAVGLLMLGDYKSNGVRIALFIGLLFLLFVAFSHGFSTGLLIEGGPAIAILVFGIVGRKQPLLSAIFFVLIAAAAAYYFVIARSHAAMESRIGVAFVLIMPLFITAFCFFRGWKAERQISTEAVGWK